MSTGRFLLIILVSFACTFFLRALPFLAFSGEKSMPPWLEKLSHALPPAIMAVLMWFWKWREARILSVWLGNVLVPMLL